MEGKGTKGTKLKWNKTFVFSLPLYKFKISNIAMLLSLPLLAGGCGLVIWRCFGGRVVDIWLLNERLCD